MDRRISLAVALGLVLVACASSGATTAEPTTTTTTTTSTSTTTTTSTTVPLPPDRVVREQDWIAFGVAVDVTMHYPSRRVERVGFHQSNDEGARHIEPLDTGIPATTLDSRGRLSDPNSSADVVVDPASDIRSPVSGTVISTGQYDLYCDLYDDFINIEPDDHPGWKVRVIHITGIDVHKGERVEAGVTVIAPGARILPFVSDVDNLRTQDPAWPHVHMEVVDPSIPNVPNGGSGYENC
jgi:hypothetical protein